MTENKPLLLLFDGNALIHRAFHALPPLTVVKTGEMINGVKGFAGTILKVLRDIKPSYWAIAFDRPAPTFRQEMFEQYKAQRAKTPPELVSQIKRAHEVAEAFHLPVFEIDGFEADDVLGTLTEQAGSKGLDVMIVTGDNDMFQLIRPGVRVLTPGRPATEYIPFDEAAVQEKYEVKPSQLIDLKALAGDPSDNIPGVPGIGKKTAAKLLQQFGSLENMYENLYAVAPARLQELLQSNREGHSREKNWLPS
jgi:DNA polymerase-1